MSQITKLKFKLSDDFKINKIDMHGTGVMYIEDVFDEETPENLIQLGHQNKEFFLEFYDEIRKYDRWYPSEGDTLHNEDLIAVARAMMECKAFQDAAIGWNDLSWKAWREFIHFRYELQFTRYMPNQNCRYNWHTDTAQSRILNWIYYINDDFVGGETQIANENEYSMDREVQKTYTMMKSFKPKRNSLLIMPSWLIHRVTPVLSGGIRQTLNGHVQL